MSPRETSSHTQLLVRRQLLAMERERTRDACKRAEEDVGRYAGIIDALTARRSCVEQNDDASSDAWHFPELRNMRAWKRFFDDTNYSPDAQPHLQAILDGAPRRVAFVLGGGAGDLLKATTLFPALFDRFGKIHCFIDNIIAKEILDNNPYVASLSVLACNPYQYAREVLHFLPIFDLVACWRYAVSYALPPRSRLAEEEITSLLSRAQLEGRDFEKYHFVNDVWPIFNNGFGRDMMTARRGVIDVSGATSALGIDRDSPLQFFPRPRALSVAQLHHGKPYITVHHGFDLNHLPGKTTKTTYGSTKNLPLDLWAEIIVGLDRRGIDVVQLGATGETALPGVRYVYNGQTKFGETALLIKNALCHVDTEGGLVHLARAVHKRAVVLFGPTPVEVFGYNQNINLQPRQCNACWYTTANWVVQCPRQTQGPQCMEEHLPADVLHAIDSLLSSKSAARVEFSPVATQDMNSLAAMVAPFIDAAKAQSLWIGAADAFEAADPLRSALVSLSDSPTGAEPRQKQVRYASPLSLPIEDESYDIAIVECETLRDRETAGELIREVCRALRRNGVLLALPASGRADGAVLHDLDLMDAIETVDLHVSNPSAVPELLREPFVLRKLEGNEQIVPGEDTESASPVDEPKWPRTRALSSLEADVLEDRQSISSDLNRVEQLLREREAIDDRIWQVRSEIFKSQHFSGGWIHFIHSEMDAELRTLLVDGWHGTETWGVWGVGFSHSLALPLPHSAAQKDVVAEFEYRLISVPNVAWQDVIITNGCEELGRLPRDEYGGIFQLVVPNAKAVANGCLRLVFRVARPIVPAAYLLGADDRSLGLGLSKLRYRVL